MGKDEILRSFASLRMTARIIQGGGVGKYGGGVDHSGRRRGQIWRRRGPFRVAAWTIQGDGVDYEASYF
jgi:hypothetical protein